MEINISQYKALRVALSYSSSRLKVTRSNAFSRIDIVESPAVRFAPGLSLRYKGSLPSQIGITIDGNDLGAITSFKGKREGLRFTAYLPSSLPYYLKRIKKVLIFEPRGGLDILTALYHEVESVIGIETNPLIPSLLKMEYGQFSGHIYQQKGVRIKIGEGRNDLRHTKEHFDLIQIPISNALGASSTGIYGLVESYRFTKEAFKEYYSHLNRGGYLVISCYLLPPPREELRLLSTAIASLEEMGLPSPEKKLAIISSWGTLTLLLKRGNLGKEEISNLKAFSRRLRFDLVYYPSIRAQEANIYNRFERPIYYLFTKRILDREERIKLYKGYLFNIEPVSDDKPFFYHFFKWKKAKELYLSIGQKWQIFMEGAFLTALIWIQALLLSLLFILAPLFYKRDYPKGSIPLLSYFFFIGMGFMFIEISLIQRFILFLDHPVYATSAVLFAILSFAGVGSYLSQRRFLFKGITLLLSGVVIFYIFLLPILFNLFLGKGLLIRYCLTILFLAPLGILMGMPFPRGISILKGVERSFIPWAWAINGCSSVLNSVSASLIALELGFTWVLLFASLAYFLSFLCLTSHRHKDYPS